MRYTRENILITIIIATTAISMIYSLRCVDELGILAKGFAFAVVIYIIYIIKTTINSGANLSIIDFWKECESDDFKCLDHRCELKSNCKYYCTNISEFGFNRNNFAIRISNNLDCQCFIKKKEGDDGDDA